YDPVEGLFPRKSDAILLLRLDLLRPNDLSLVVIIGYMITVTCLLPSRTACVAHALFWLLAHWISIGTLLRRQRLGKNTETESLLHLCQ
ncbi:hypothetical protein BVRB_033860, partial [Beta vulgaris subsp. vulgaris]